MEQVDGVTVVSFKDRRLLDAAAIEVVAQQLYSLVDDHGCQKVVLDFSVLEYMSSAAIGKLVNFHKKLLSVQGALRMCNLKPEMEKIIKVLGLRKMFQIDKNRDKSLKKI